MTYATRADMLMAFGEAEVNGLLDRNRDGADDAGVLDEALAFADSLINGYIGERYSVPLETPPRNLVGIACDIARYRLYQNQPTDLVQTRYDVGCFWLKDVARGLVSLNLHLASEVAAVAYSTPSAIFTRLVW